MGNDSQLTVVEDAKKDEFVTQVRRNVETSQYLNELRANIREGQRYVEISRHSITPRYVFAIWIEWASFKHFPMLKHH